MDAGISEHDAQLISNEYYKALRTIQRLQSKVENLTGIVEDQDALTADRARLEQAISQINDLASGASERDIQARIRAIREVARTA